MAPRSIPPREGILLGKAPMVWVLLALTACDGSMPSDGGVDADATDGGRERPTEPAPPAPAALPDFACPAGWTLVASDLSDTPVGCDPWPAPGPSSCSDGQAHFPGRPACEAIGSVCPADGFPPVPEGLVPRYVAPTGVSGDGSRDRPHGSIAEALRAAGASSSQEALLLRRGDYREAVSLDVRLTLVGACASDTRLLWDGPGAALAVGPGGDVVARDLTLAGASPTRAAASSGGRLALVDVLLEGAGSAAVVEGAGSEVTVRRARARQSEGQLEEAFVAIDGGRMTLDHIEARGFADAIGAGHEGTLVTVTDSVFGAEGEGFVDLRGGAGLWAWAGARVEGARVVFDRLATHAIDARGSPTEVAFEHAWIEAVRATGDTAYGASASSGAHVSLRRSTVVDADVTALRTSEDGSELVFEDSSVASVYAVGERLGYGLLSTWGGLATLRRAVVEDAEHVGVVSFDGGAVRVEDVRVASTVGDPTDSSLGWGVLVYEASRLEGARLRSTLNHHIGLAAIAGALVHVDDLVVDQTRRSASANGEGHGIVAVEGSEVVSTRALLDRNVDIALKVFDEGTRVRLVDARIESTEAAWCADADCATRVGGIGAGAYAGGTIELERFVVSGHELIALQVAHGAEDAEGTMPFPNAGHLVLLDGEVTRNPVGLNVQSSDFDYDQLESVLFRDNELNVTATELPVPRPTDLPAAP